MTTQYTAQLTDTRTRVAHIIAAILLILWMDQQLGPGCQQVDGMAFACPNTYQPDNKTFPVKPAYCCSAEVYACMYAWVASNEYMRLRVCRCVTVVCIGK